MFVLFTLEIFENISVSFALGHQDTWNFKLKWFKQLSNCLIELSHSFFLVQITMTDFEYLNARCIIYNAILYTILLKMYEI